MRRDERSAAVRRFDDDTSGAKPGDDAVAGDISRAVLPGLRMKFRDQCAAVIEDVAGYGRMLRRRHFRQRVGQHGDGRHSRRQCRAVRRDVDPESQSADDAESRHLRRESLHEPVAHGLSVGRRIARADHRQTACRKGCRITFYV